MILAVENDPFPAGIVIEEKMTMGMKKGVMKVALGEQVMEGTISIHETEFTESEGLGEDVIRYTVTEGSKTEKAVMMGQGNPEEKTESPIQGVPLIAEKKKSGKWNVKVEDGEETMEMKEKISDYADSLNEDLDTKIYGTNPRKVGEEWECSGDKLFGLENSIGKMELKLESIEEFQGESCAKISGSLNITAEGFGDEAGMTVKMNGDFILFRSLQHRCDLSIEMVGKMVVQGELEPQPGAEMSFKMEGPMTITGTSSIKAME